MNERPSSHIERYQAMTPQQRNAEMQKIFELRPTNFLTRAVRKNNPLGVDQDGEVALDIKRFFELLGTSDRSIANREKSPLRNILVMRLRALLSYAKTTEAFKSYLIASFDEEFILGVEKGLGDVLSEAEFFKWRDHLSGGIFDEDVVKDIEGSSYKFLWLMTGIKQEIVRKRKQDNSPQELTEELEDKLIKESNFLDQWLLEYIKKYNEIPPHI